MTGMMGKVGVAKRQGQRNEGDKVMTGHGKVGVVNNGDNETMGMTGTMK